MDNIKPTLTIGIPSLNEYKNLKRLLLEIKKQNLNSARRVDVVIMSDGSNDETKTLKKDNCGLHVKVVTSKNRHGKPYQLNKLFKITHTDLLIVLDADITLTNRLVLASLISASKKNKNALVSGVALPEKPKNQVQKIAYAGVSLWDRIRFSGKHSTLYLCEGSVRCFPKKLYKKIKFPNTSADEAFSYLAAKGLNYGFLSSTKSIVRYHLPENIRDYYLQLRRYLNSENIQTVNFSGQDISKEYDIHYREKLIALFENFKQDPLYTFLYSIFVFFVKITVHLKPARHSSRWLILNSTKRI